MTASLQSPVSQFERHTRENSDSEGQLDDLPAIRSSRFFCSLFFLGAGVGIGAWASSLPVLSAQMELDKAQLGWILIGFALGAIVMMTNIGRLAAIAPSSVLSLLGSLTFGAALLALPYAGGTYWLALIVFFAGIGFGTLDV
ncbi:MAG: MFS transporter, partial [Mesorhizobium sp.]